VENIFAEETEIVLWVLPPPTTAGPLVEITQTAIARSRSLGGRRKISNRDRSISLTGAHRLEGYRERERRQRRDSGSSRVLIEEIAVVLQVPLVHTAAGSLPVTAYMVVFKAEKLIED